VPTVGPIGVVLVVGVGVGAGVVVTGAGGSSSGAFFEHAPSASAEVRMAAAAIFDGEKVMVVTLRIMPGEIRSGG
jgi:glycerol dehydrogenase-like iron-containing ADH family enzyme